MHCVVFAPRLLKCLAPSLPQAHWLCWAHERALRGDRAAQVMSEHRAAMSEFLVSNMLVRGGEVAQGRRGEALCAGRRGATRPSATFLSFVPRAYAPPLSPSPLSPPSLLPLSRGRWWTRSTAPSAGRAARWTCGRRPSSPGPSPRYVPTEEGWMGGLVGKKESSSERSISSMDLLQLEGLSSPGPSPR